MSGDEREVRKSNLALALAQGMSAPKWGEKNGVKKSTAYKWAAEPEMRTRVNSIRRRALDRYVGRLSKRLVWSAEGVVQIADKATSESVRLSALRAIPTDMFKACTFGSLDDRMTALEARFNGRTENAS
jgi:transposase